jgi:hypothetical protein
MRRLLPFLALSIFKVAACSPQSPPLIPAWDLDVYPILRGSCSHCHGSTTRTGAMATSPSSRYDICTSAPIDMAFKPENITVGSPGASPMAGVFALYTDPNGMNPGMRMPPPPASPLTEYELTVLGRWANPKVANASCKKSVVNQKPTAKLISQFQVPGTDRVAVILEADDPDGDQVFGYVRLGNSALQVITGAGRGRYEFPGANVADRPVVKLHDGWDQGP